jgi:hypothetical protein
MVSTYRAGRRIRLEPDRWREPGELVPEAHTWFRLDSYLHTGWLVAVDVEETDLRAAVARFCPDLAATVLTNTGLDGARLHGPSQTPRHRRTRTPADTTGPTVGAGTDARRARARPEG